MEEALPEAGSTPISMAKPADERPVVLITTVDIGGGKSDKIELRQGEEPEDVARAFCELHSIPAAVVGPLTAHILDNLRNAPAAQPVAAPAEPKQTANAYEEEEEDLEEGAAPAEEDEHPLPPLAASGHPKLTFKDGMNDKLYEQLSAKLLPVDDNSHLLTVGNSMGGRPLSSRTAVSNRASAMSIASDARASYSAEGSPTKVHHRLYKHALDMKHRQDAKRRAVADELTASMSHQRSSMSWISQEMMRDRTHGPYENYGEMLYAEGLEAVNVRQSKAKLYKDEREASELAGATFMPQITRLAQALWAGEDLDSQPVWQRLSIDKRARTLETVRQWKEAKEKAEMKECTFKPKINRASIQIMSERSEVQKSLNMSAHEQLYADAERRRQKMQELQTWLPDEVTFKPNVNRDKQSEAALQHSLERLGLQDELSSPNEVVNRLYMSMERTRAKLEEKRAEMYGKTDPATGKELYKPEVGRAPRSVARNPEGLPISEHLYQTGQELAAKKEAALEAERQAALEAANAAHTTSVSQRMYDRLRLKRFTQIFEYLDEEGEGQLDLVGITRSPSAQMDNLDNEVREDVETAAALHALASGVPLMPDPNSYSGEGITAAIAGLPPAPCVDAAGFAALMERALTKRRKPRAYLVPSPSSKNQQAATYQPTINKRSRELAARLRPAEVPLYEALHQSGEASKQRLEEARRRADEAALSQCTFAPQLSAVANGMPVEGRALRAANKAIAAGAVTAAQRAVGGVAADNSPPPKPAAPTRGGSYAQQAPSAKQLIQQQAAELEVELQQALQGVSVAQDRLGALDHQGDASAQEMRATEAMLLDLLTASSPHGTTLDSEADTAVINQLHRVLVSEPAGAGSLTAGSRSMGRSGSRKAQAAVVAPQGLISAGSGNGASTLQQLEGLLAAGE